MIEEYNLEDIYIRHAIDDCPAPANFNMHIHDRCEIYLFISGSVTYLVEGSSYPLTQNSLMIMSPAESHCPKILGSNRYERYVINFPLSFASSWDPEGRLMKACKERALGKNNMFHSSEINTALIQEFFIHIFSEKDDYGRKLTARAHLLTMLDMIHRALEHKANQEHSQNSLSEQVVLYVNEHLFEELTVPMLAEHFFLSSSHFNRLFKNATGAAPWDYITKKRLTVAKDLILNGVSSQVACERSGFKDYSSFYRGYKKHFGHAPNEDSSKQK